ncbi:MAG: iron-sulfur cluster biosynthesis family protein [Pseudomonadota bacterium]
MRALTRNEITITPDAVKYLESVRGDAAAIHLRIAAGKGCGGHEYKMEPVATWDDTVPDLYIQVSADLRLTLEPADLMKLFGMRIDYVTDTLGNRKIEITNPNEKGRCGCGQSPAF